MDPRRALEALRNGVPNRDAVRILGCSQAVVERRFAAQLSAVELATKEERQVTGLLVSGGFGSGKSHLLEYLQHLALSANFVCSQVVISKETPLYDPAKVFRAAIQNAVVPGLSGQAIPEMALRFQKNSPEYVAFAKWAYHKDSKLSPLFPATLYIHEHLSNDPELVEAVTGFWSGEKLPISNVRQGLRQAGAQTAFVLRTVTARDLALQRMRFAAKLICGAGYRGWVLLLDEVELIGMYSLLQRARSYGELARWLGKVEGDPYPGLIAVAAITDDFDLAVLQEKGDRDYVRPKLESRETPEFTLLVGRAETGMKAIQYEAETLATPDEAMLRATYEQLKRVHGEAYNWEPPDISGGATFTSRRLRSYVRRWIIEWDLKRLYGGRGIHLIEDDLRPTYGEDQELEAPADDTQSIDDQEPGGGVDASPLS